MTCNRDCVWCLYGFREESGWKCGAKNITCDGECHKCPFRIAVSVRYVCRAGELFGRFDGTAADKGGRR